MWAPRVWEAEEWEGAEGRAEDRDFEGGVSFCGGFTSMMGYEYAYGSGHDD